MLPSILAQKKTLCTHKFNEQPQNRHSVDSFDGVMIISVFLSLPMDCSCTSFVQSIATFGKRVTVIFRVCTKSNFFVFLVCFGCDTHWSACLMHHKTKKWSSDGFNVSNKLHSFPFTMVFAGGPMQHWLRQCSHKVTILCQFSAQNRKQNCDHGINH